MILISTPESVLGAGLSVTLSATWRHNMREDTERELEYGDIRDYDDQNFLPGGKHYDPDLDEVWD